VGCLIRGKKETTGQYDHRTMRDTSFDDSNPMAALIEDYTPSLTHAAAVGDSSHESAHEGLMAFTNGTSGRDHHGALHEGMNGTVVGVATGAGEDVAVGGAVSQSA
jgi:aconitase B